VLLLRVTLPLALTWLNRRTRGPPQYTTYQDEEPQHATTGTQEEAEVSAMKALAQIRDTMQKLDPTQWEQKQIAVADYDLPLHQWSALSATFPWPAY